LARRLGTSRESIHFTPVARLSPGRSSPKSAPTCRWALWSLWLLEALNPPCEQKILAVFTRGWLASHTCSSLRLSFISTLPLLIDLTRWNHTSPDVLRPLPLLSTAATTPDTPYTPLPSRNRQRSPSVASRVSNRVFILPSPQPPVRSRPELFF
jgi:hypothetical protein